MSAYGRFSAVRSMRHQIGIKFNLFFAAQKKRSPLEYSHSMAYKMTVQHTFSVQNEWLLNRRQQENERTTTAFSLKELCIHIYMNSS